MKAPSIKKYYSALQAQFRLQASILTDVLPHAGERGRNNEERFREFLSRVLPKRYSVGSGFIICSEPDVPVSSQTDVVLFDEFLNAPIHRELASHVYPVEIVYGAVEVKGCLEKRDLKKILDDIAKIRVLGQHRYYLQYTGVPKAGGLPGNFVVGATELQSKLPPRAFVFAYRQKGWKSIDDLVAALSQVGRETAAHIHGLAVLESDWYVSQEPYAEKSPSFNATEGDALLNFINGMLHQIGSLEMRQMSIDRYYSENA